MRDLLFTSVGMPVLVFEQHFGADAFTYAKRGAGISAETFLAADIRNNFVFLESRSSEQIPIISPSPLSIPIAIGN